MNYVSLNGISCNHFPFNYHYLSSAFYSDQFVDLTRRPVLYNSVNAGGP